MFASFAFSAIAAPTAFAFSVLFFPFSLREETETTVFL
jgi:hypothetical protein